MKLSLFVYNTLWSCFTAVLVQCLDWFAAVVVVVGGL